MSRGDGPLCGDDMGIAEKVEAARRIIVPSRRRDARPARPKYSGKVALRFAGYHLS